MKLTSKQKRIRDFIVDFSRENGYSPTYREIIEALGYASVNSAVSHLKVIKKKGFVTFIPGKARTVRVIEKEAKAS
jgi:repressor LexA